jgi:hypothetical protein
MRLLVLTPEPVDDRLLRAAVGDAVDDAAGDTGESEPAVALQDALATFPADRIVVISHPKGTATTARTRASRASRSATGSRSRTPRSDADRPNPGPPGRSN